MGLKKELDKLKFDKRLTDYNFKSGKLKKEEHAAHLAGLEDTADNVYNEEDDDLDNPGVFDDEDTSNEGVDDTNMTDDAEDTTGGEGSLS